jgi:hypothetical protein
MTPGVLTWVIWIKGDLIYWNGEDSKRLELKLKLVKTQIGQLAEKLSEHTVKWQ